MHYRLSDIIPANTGDRFFVEIVRYASDDVWGGTCSEYPVIVHKAYGDTKDQARQNALVWSRQNLAAEDVRVPTDWRDQTCDGCGMPWRDNDPGAVDGMCGHCA